MNKFLLCLLLSFHLATSQAPNISYISPNVFNIGETISPLSPTNNGGIIAAGRIVSTFAGSGNTGSEDGIGTAASFNLPTVVTLDHLGNIFVVDRMNNKIRKITPDGTVSSFAGSGEFGSDDGPATTATFVYPDGAVFDSQNNLFISDQSNHKIRKITPDGTVSTFAGTGIIGADDGAGAVATFYYPAGMAVDSMDNLYVADYGNNKIRKITPDGIVSTFAGTGVAGTAEGIAAEAEFNGVTGVTVDSFGNVYAADYYNNKIRKIDTLGNVTTVAGSGAIGSDDGLGANASFYYPAIVAVDLDNNLWVTDEENHKIRKIDTLGNVTTFAGDGTIGATDGIATSAQFNYPTGVAIDANHNVFVCDYGNNKIRKINEYGYTISPDLPNGLNFDTTTGIISGTPTTSLTSTDFTISASNPDGISSYVINITVGELGLDHFNVESIKVYPNPAKDILLISAVTNISEIKITNPLGQEVLDKKNLSLSETITISELAHGWYIVKVVIHDSVKIFKIFKQ